MIEPRLSDQLIVSLISDHLKDYLKEIDPGETWVFIRDGRKLFIDIALIGENIEADPINEEIVDELMDAIEKDIGARHAPDARPQVAVDWKLVPLSAFAEHKGGNEGVRIWPWKAEPVVIMPAASDFQFSGVVIGVFGPARSGKDTVYEIVKKRRAHVERFAFADPIKKFCGEIYGWTDDQLYGAMKDEPDERYRRPDGTFLTPRFAMQQLGTEWGRNCYVRTWIDYCFRKMETQFGRSRFVAKAAPPPGSFATTGVGHAVIEKTEIAVITDVRFQNELEAILAAGGYVIKLVRPRIGLKGEAANHASESDFDKPEVEALVSAVVENSGTLDELALKIEAVINKLRI